MFWVVIFLCNIFLAVDSSNYCEILRETYQNDDPPRYLMIYGKIRNISVLWGGTTTSRLNAAFFTVALQIGLGYQNVQLKQGPRDVCSFSNKLKEYEDSEIYEFYIHPYLEWAGNDLKECPGTKCSVDEDHCGPAGPRLTVLGKHSSATDIGLFIHLALDADHKCDEFVAWNNFAAANASELTTCKFMLSEETLGINGNINYKEVILDASETPKVITEVAQRIAAWNLQLIIKENVTQNELYNLLNEGNQSFLFLAQDTFIGMSRVYQTQLPPCPMYDKCSNTAIDSTIIVTAASHQFQKYAPRIFKTLLSYIHQKDSVQLREIIQMNADLDETSERATEAVCKWISNSATNEKRFRRLVTEEELPFEAVVILCEDDPDLEEYIKVIKTVGDLHINHINSSFIGMAINVFKSKCDEPNSILKIVKDLCDKNFWLRLVGFVVIGSYKGTKQAADYAIEMETPMILYDTSGDEIPRSEIVRASSASVENLTNTTRYFLHLNNWNRIAVLSLKQNGSANFAESLLSGRSFSYLEEVINGDSDINEKLLKFKSLQASVYFLNTDSYVSVKILCSAWILGMTPDNGFVYILREWRSELALPLDCGKKEMRFITITNTWYGDPISQIYEPGKLLRNELDKLWPNRSWPTLASSIADALLVLAQGFTEYIKSNKERRYELHGKNSSSKFGQSLDKKITEGIAQELIYNNNILEHVLVYVNEWENNKHKLLAVWNVSHNNISDVIPLSLNFLESAVSDNSIHCLTTKSRDEFTPHCHDVAWIIIIIMIIIALITLYIARRCRLASLIKRDKELLARLLASRNRAAAQLATHLVERSALEMREELGRGQFGRVHFAILRTPGQSPREVAAKVLIDEASASEESEFLREACVLASLDHVNIIKLLGVCAIDGPPVVLMEHAKFGDLIQYLKARRPLAEALRELADLGPVAEGEAKYVTSVELTRLGREAAAALTYLASKKLVHRDIRAANCLINASRTLKIGDFGMVRQVGSNTNGHEEYECRRRGMFPVLWMAPESLDRGVFSIASDVWSLGILLSEIVTLGERPYCTWSPLRVIQYVLAGGVLPLPLDVSAKTREIILLCCSQDTWRRISAADVVAYLALYPRALRSALLPVRTFDDRRSGGDVISALNPESPQPDSGYGEEAL